MSEQSSNTSLTASAFYDPESSSWRTSQGSLLSEEYPLLERLPDWATTADGALCVQATPGHLIAVRDGSASPNLPTPVVNDMGRGKTPDEWDSWPDEMKHRHGNGNGHGASLAIEAARLLPTPRSFLAHMYGRALLTTETRQNFHANLEEVIALLPTPTARDWKDQGENVDLTRSATKGHLSGLPLMLLPTPTTVDAKVFGPNVD